MSATNDADALARRMVVRHKEAGHLRLELPAELCGPLRAAAIEDALRRVDGVYRVILERYNRKLSVRYDPLQCGQGEVVRALRYALDALPDEAAVDSAAATAATATTTGATAAIAANADPVQTLIALGRAVQGGVRSLAAQVGRGLAGNADAPGQEAPATPAASTASTAPAAPPGSLQARLQPLVAGALTEKAAINFLNDLVAFYLIKVHWDLITKRWIKAPLAHADAWGAAFYLVFLMVRFRKGLQKK